LEDGNLSGFYEIGRKLPDTVARDRRCARFSRGDWRQSGAAKPAANVLIGSARRRPATVGRGFVGKVQNSDRMLL